MRVPPLILVACAGLAASGAASGATTQPPMGAFDGAYYTCDQGQAFQISYDSKKAEDAKVTTSADDATYQLKRVPDAAGADFSNGSVKVSVSGDAAQLQGTPSPFTDCKLKNTI